MERKKILWLVSWYPNRNDRFDGDFIQRHARAAAIYHDIHVIYVTEAQTKEPVEEEWNYVTGLTEQIIYFKKKNGWPSALINFMAWKKYFKQAIGNYIDKHGLPHHVHVHVPWKAGVSALWLKRQYGLPYVLSEHWGMYDRNVEDNFFTKPSWVQYYTRKVYEGAISCISVSRFLSGQIKKVTGKKCDTVIPNVVDTTLFFYNEEKYSKFSFVHVSNMTRVKNVSTILEAFKDLKSEHEDIQLIMVGNRDEEYVHYAAELGLLNSSVYFQGEIPYQEVASEMKRNHCLVLASASETFSCVTAEALCCGLPVVAPSVGALPELIEDANGLLVTPGDRGALTQAMGRIMKEYQSYDGKKIAENASRKYGYAAIAGAFRDLYQRLSLEVPVAGEV